MNSIKVPKGFSLAALHVHTDYSDGICSPRDVVRFAAKGGIKVLAITDHDTISGYEVAKKAGQKYGVHVVCGEEIQTSLPRGLHIIGLFLKKPISHSKPLSWTIGAIKKQGGLAVIPHPCSRLFRDVFCPTAAMLMRDLEKIIAVTKIDGIELRYTGILDKDKRTLDEFWQENKGKLGAEIGSADSHFGEFDLFSYLTVFPGTSSLDLYRAIKSRKTRAVQGFEIPVSLKFKILQKKRAWFDLGLKRYRNMLGRWLRFNFVSVDENI